MPVFTQRPIQVAVGKKRGIPEEVLEVYRKHIVALEKGNEGVMEFGKGEDIRLGRRALVEASIVLKKYVVVRKIRGAENMLVFRRISKKEHDESQKGYQAMVDKRKMKKRAKPAKKKSFRRKVAKKQ